MKKFLLLIFLAIISTTVTAQNYNNGGSGAFNPYGSAEQQSDTTSKKKKDNKDIVHQHYTYKWMHDGVYKKLVDEDTLFTGAHIVNPMFRLSKSNTYLAPMGSPYQSNIYILRDLSEPTYYNNLIRAFIFKPEDALLYNVTTPYTALSYASAGSRGRNETNMNVTHNQNITPHWNAGFRYNLNRADGRFLYSTTKVYDFSVFSNFEKDRFAFEFFVNQNNGHFNENGGIVDRQIVKDTTEKTDNLLVNLEDGTSNHLRNFNFYTNLQYQFGKKAFTKIKDTIEEIIPNKQFTLCIDSLKAIIGDTLITDSTIILSAQLYLDSLQLALQKKQIAMDTMDVVRYDTTWSYISKFIVSLNIENNYRNFIEKAVTRDYFEHNYINSRTNTDRFHEKIYDIGAKMVFNEIPKHPYLPGIFVGANLDMRYSRQRLSMDTTKQNTQDTASVFYSRKFTNVYVSGGIFNVDTNAKLNYDAQLRICLAGEYIGNFSVGGYIKQKLNPNSYVQANASYRFEDVNLYWKYYAGNHDYWYNDNMSEEKELRIEAKYVNDKWRSEFGAAYTNTDGYVWMDSTFNIRQESKPISTYTAWIKQHFKVWKLHFVEQVYLQKSSNEEILSLPLVSVYSSNYIELTTRNKAMTVNIGVDLSYDTKFYADNYRPSTMTFYNQRWDKQGNTIESTAFIDLRIARCNIFLKYEHFDYYLRKGGGNYFSAYSYPTNPPLFRFGLRWSFFD